MNCKRKIISNKWLAIFLLLKMVFFHCHYLQANPDSTNIIRYLVRLEYTKVNLEQDTIVTKINLDTLQNNRNKKEDIYTRLQKSSNKNYVTRKLYGLFFRKQNIDIAARVFSKASAMDKFIEYKEKKIYSIKFLSLNAFGQSVYDSTLTPTSWLENSGNRLHIKTANFLIRNTLLFKVGDFLNPVDFAESEQLLRSHDFIEDANIVVAACANDSNYVDVNVITKDAWSIGIDYRYGNKYSSQLQLYDKNLGGLGVYLSSDLYYDSRKQTNIGRKYELSVFNIGGSFIDGNVWERRGQGYETYAFNFKRDFYASKAKYGGGASILKSFEPYSFLTIDKTQRIRYNNYDYWIGRSFRVSRKDFLKSPHNLVLGFRFISKYFSVRPNVGANQNYFFHNKEYYLIGLSLTKQDLFRANLIYSLGSTEDIPTGFRIQFTNGLERGEFENRYYIGNEFSAAELTPWGYIFSSARLGGFLTTQNQIQQVTSNLRTTYFSNLFRLGNVRLRQFVKIDYTRGISRFYGAGEEGESIFLDSNNGIRGLSSRDMSGTTRLVINLETVAFSPLYLYGFRFAFFGFGDFGMIGSAKDYVIGNQSFSGFGIGVRIRNENLVLNAISIRLGYYPRLPSNADVAYWLITGQQRTRFEHFRPNEPQILPFE